MESWYPGPGKQGEVDISRQDAHSSAPATTVNRRAGNPDPRNTGPSLAPPFGEFFSILLRSWWPAAPPVKRDSSSCAVPCSTSWGEVWLAGAEVGLVVEVVVVGAPVEVVLEEVWAGVEGARVVGGGSRTRGGIRGEKYVLLRRSELQRGPWQQEPLSVNPGPVTPSRVQDSSCTQPRTGKDTVTLAVKERHRKVCHWADRGWYSLSKP